MSDSCSPSPSPRGQPVGASVERAGGPGTDTPLNERPTLPGPIDRVAEVAPETTGDTIRDQFGRVFNADTDGKAFGLKLNTITVQHLVGITCAVTGCKNQRITIKGFSIVENGSHNPPLMKLKIGQTFLEKYSDTKVDQMLSEVDDNLAQAVGANMRTSFNQNIFRGTTIN